MVADALEVGPRGSSVTSSFWVRQNKRFSGIRLANVGLTDGYILLCCPFGLLPPILRLKIET